MVVLRWWMLAQSVVGFHNHACVPTRLVVREGQPFDTSPSWLGDGSGSQRPPPSSRDETATPLAVPPKFDSQPSWMKAVTTASNPRMTRAYNVACIIWIGAMLDALRAVDVVAVASFALASASAKILATAAKADRLASPSYRRLNACLAVFGLGQVALYAARANPATAAAHLVAAGSPIAGMVATRASLLGEVRDLFLVSLPSIRSPMANAYLLLVVAPALCALVSTPPTAALAACVFGGVGLVLKDGAARSRLNASTFRRLNLALGLSLAVLVKHVVFAAPRQAPFLATIAVVGSLLAFANGVAAVLVAGSL